MTDFILDYEVLEMVANYSKSLGKRADEYADDLESKIISGIGTVTGPSSGYLLSASDSVRDKITALRQKSEAFYLFAEQIIKLLEVAEQMDQEVADAITAQRGELEHKKSMGLEDWKAKLINLLVDIKNGSPLLATIAHILGGMDTIHESLEDSIKHWYECEGGKRTVKGALGNIEAYSDNAGLASTGIGVIGLFNGNEFKMLKNGLFSRSDLNYGKENGNVELKNNIKKLYSKGVRNEGKGKTKKISEKELRKQLKELRNTHLKDTTKMKSLNSTYLSVNIILKYDSRIEEVSTQLNIEKELIQAILYRELICYGLDDVAIDIVVRQYYMSKKIKMPATAYDIYNMLNLDGRARDSSTGLGQIYASTAIEAERLINNNNLLFENNEDDLGMMWQRLQDPETNIYYVGLVLKMKAKKLNIDLNTATRKEKIKVLAKYNANIPTAYGHHVIKYYDLFKKYNQ